MSSALAKKYSYSIQPEKTITEVSSSFDGKKLIFLFENGEGYAVRRSVLPHEDGSPLVFAEIFDHRCAVKIHLASGVNYDLPWDSIKHYAKGGAQKKVKVGRRIAILRKLKKISQSKLAKLTGLSRMQLSRLESNVSSPTFDTLLKITHALKVMPAELMGN